MAKHQLTPLRHTGHIEEHENVRNILETSIIFPFSRILRAFLVLLEYTFRKSAEHSNTIGNYCHMEGFAEATKGLHHGL